VAEHLGGTALQTVDYHEQYGQGAFVEALRHTRLRQARRILELLKETDPSATSLLDFGCGRGWFIEAARQTGRFRLAGADSSPLAVDLLRANGVEGMTVPGDVTAPFSFDRLSFQPEVLTLLDVVEHFPGPVLTSTLMDLVQRLRSGLRLVIIKVPVSNGLLYRIASALSAFGFSAPIEQLYQVGTTPPHESYFSKGSALELLRKCGLELVRVEFDRDFEATSLTARARALKALPRLARISGETIALLVTAFGFEDSVILLARPSDGRDKRSEPSS
jgi:SAM-dependent methyltransferase